MKPNPLTCSIGALNTFYPNHQAGQCNCNAPEMAKHTSWCSVTPIYAELWSTFGSVIPIHYWAWHFNNALIHFPTKS